MNPDEVKRMVVALFREGTLNGQEAMSIMMLAYTCEITATAEHTRESYDSPFFGPSGRRGTIESEIRIKIKLSRRFHRAPPPVEFTEDVNWSEYHGQQQAIAPPPIPLLPPHL